MLINERIVSVLKEKGLTQRDMSAFIGVSSSTLNNWLKKNSDIPAQYIIPISEFLQETPLFVLGAQETKKASPPAMAEDEAKALKYYQQLESEEHRDYIKGEMIRLRMAEEAEKQDAEFSDELAK